MTPLDQYVAPAMNRRGFWRVFVGILLILVCWVAGMILVLTAWTLAKMMDGMTIDQVLLALEALPGSGQPQGIAIMLASFAGIWAGVALACLFLHGQRFRTIFTPGGPGALRDLGRGMLFGLVFMIPSTAMGLLVADPVPGQQFTVWLIWIVPIVLLVFVQATGEELIFRGYLLQQLRGRWRHWAVWAVLPSVVFGLLHITGQRDDGGDIYYVAITAIMGIAMAVLVWRTGNLMAAIGLHVTVNTLSLTVIGPGGDLAGTQLWSFPEAALTALYQVDLIIVTLMLVFVLSPLGNVFGHGDREI